MVDGTWSVNTTTNNALKGLRLSVTISGIHLYQIYQQ